MKKVFISVPMRGRQKEEIEKSITTMHKIAEAVFEQELEVINTKVKDIPPIEKAAVWCLGESIKKMAGADCYAGVQFAFDNFGCLTENEVARRYFSNENCCYIPVDLIIPEYTSEYEKKMNIEKSE